MKRTFNQSQKIGDRGEEILRGFLDLKRIAYLGRRINPDHPGGDIDVVAVGRWGLAVLDAKHWMGARVDAKGVLYQGQHLRTDVVHKVVHQAAALDRLLHQIAGFEDLRTHCALVFTRSAPGGYKPGTVPLLPVGSVAYWLDSLPARIGVSQIEMLMAVASEIYPAFIRRPARR